MEVILLERVGKLGQMGDVVRVKDGFARNFLLPKGKALRANSENKAKFESMKSQLQVRNLELKGDAQTVASRLDGRSFIVLRQASETGQLFGSVSTRDVAILLSENGFAVSRSQIALNSPIKSIGLHKVPIALHPEIDSMITVNVARNPDEAQRIARGEDVTTPRAEADEEEPQATAEAFFENPEKQINTEGPSETSSESESTPAKSESTPAKS